MLRYFVVALLASAVWLSSHVYTKLGYSKSFMKHYPGDCRHVHGQYLGSEDLAVTSNGLAFVSSGLSQRALPESFYRYMQGNKIWGRILLFNFSDPMTGAILLKLEDAKDFDPKTFRPHGISLVEDGVKGEHLLYVISHAEPDVVEKFRFIPKTKSLLHMKTILLPGISIANDLTMLKEDQFYITNFVTFESFFMMLVEMVIPFKFGGLFFHNGSALTKVVSGLNTPNGVVLSKDRKFVYVALSMDESVLVYSRQADDRLAHVQTVKLDYALDNVQEVGQSLLVGAQPIGHKSISSMTDPKNKAPSTVVKLPLKDGLVVEEEASQLFYDHGNLISGSSVAYLHGDKLLIGSVIDTLVLCDVCTHTAHHESVKMQTLH